MNFRIQFENNLQSTNRKDHTELFFFLEREKRTNITLGQNSAQSLHWLKNLMGTSQNAVVVIVVAVVVVVVVVVVLN